MFQEPALLPWLTVRRNVELPMRIHEVDADERNIRADKLLAMVGLIDFAKHRPPSSQAVCASGALLRGHSRRIPSCCSWTSRSLLLDAITRDQLHDDLNRIWHETGKTIIFVTHNVREAVRLGDRVVLMTPRPGRVAQIWDVDIQRPRELELLRGLRARARDHHSAARGGDRP